MDIVRERPSKNGILDFAILGDVEKVTKLDNYKTRRWGSKPVVWVKYEGDKRFPIMFPNEDKRDSALNLINCSTSPVIVLDFNEFFTVKYLADEVAAKIITEKYTLRKHLFMCINSILTNEKVSLSSLTSRDAFKFFTELQLQQLYNQDPVVFKPDQFKPEIWSKTLYTPKNVTDKGITPLQFYKTLIANEKSIISDPVPQPLPDLV